MATIGKIAIGRNEAEKKTARTIIIAYWSAPRWVNGERRLVRDATISSRPNGWTSRELSPRRTRQERRWQHRPRNNFCRVASTRAQRIFLNSIVSYSANPSIHSRFYTKIFRKQRVDLRGGRTLAIFTSERVLVRKFNANYFNRVYLANIISEILKNYRQSVRYGTLRMVMVNGILSNSRSTSDVSRDGVNISWNRDVRSINLLFIVAISFLSMENSSLIFQKKKRRKKEASRQRTRARVLPTRGESLAGSQSRVRVSTCTWLHLYVRSMHTRMPRLTVPYEHRGSFGKIAKFLVTSIMLIVYWSDITRIEDFTYSALVEVNHFCFRVGRHR